MPPNAPASRPAARVSLKPGRRSSAAACMSFTIREPTACASPRSTAATRRGSIAGGSTADDERADGPGCPRNSSRRRYTAGVDSSPSATASTQCSSRSARTGSSRSPRPVPKAVPPTTENGTSLPRAAATCDRRSTGHPRPQSVLQASSAPAASALPPARPPATGMPLRTRSAARPGTPASSAKARTARTARFDPSAGTPLLYGPSSSSVTSCGIAGEDAPRA